MKEAIEYIVGNIYSVLESSAVVESKLGEIVRTAPKWTILRCSSWDEEFTTIGREVSEDHQSGARLSSAPHFEKIFLELTVWYTLATESVTAQIQHPTLHPFCSLKIHERFIRFPIKESAGRNSHPMVWLNQSTQYIIAKHLRRGCRISTSLHQSWRGINATVA